MPNINAALGLAQFKNLKKNIIRKRKINKVYSELIKKNKNFIISETPDYSYNNNWLTILRSKKPALKNKLINYLIGKKINVRPVWSTIHSQNPYKKFQTYRVDNAIKQFKSNLCLPSSANIKLNDIKYISKLINSL